MSESEFLRLSRRIKEAEQKTTDLSDDMLTIGDVFKTTHGSGQTILKLGNGMVLIMGQIPTTAVPASGVTTVYVSHMSLLKEAPIAAYVTVICNTVANIIMESYIVGTNISNTSIALRHNYPEAIGMGAAYMIVGLLN